MGQLVVEPGTWSHHVTQFYLKVADKANGEILEPTTDPGASNSSRSLSMVVPIY